MAERPVRVLLLADTHLGFDAPARPRVVRCRRGPDFFVSLEDGKDLAKVKVERVDEMSVAGLSEALRTGAGRLQRGEDASFEKSKGMVRLMPMFLLRPLLWLIGLFTGSFGVNLQGMGLERLASGKARARW